MRKCCNTISRLNLPFKRAAGFSLRGFTLAKNIRRPNVESAYLNWDWYDNAAIRIANFQLPTTSFRPLQARVRLAIVNLVDAAGGYG